ncbi:MAG: hypothetical protein VYD12_01770 [Pseudomonadota bacterium]|nr:hypothetical protein [Pseudomonadota bacterium]
MSEQMQPEQEKSNLERALAGEYKFNFKALFNRSQSLYKANLMTFLKSTGLLMLIGVGSTLVLMSVLKVDPSSVESMQSSPAGMLDIIMLIIMSPLLAGFRMLGVKLTADKPADAAELGKYFSLTLALVTLNLLTSLLIQLGFMLLILPGVYVYLVTQFAVVLLAERRAGVIQSIILSAKVVNQYLMPFLLLLVLFVLLFTLVFLTMGLAILWVGPLYTLVLGQLYNDLFAVQSEEAPATSPSQDSVLDA